MFKIQKLKTFLLLSIFYFLLSGTLVFAAEIIIDSNSQKIGVGDQFEVKFFLNTDNEDINAIEGKVIFPENLLELKEIRDGNSIVNFWIERLKVEKAGAIGFSGIIPGGYNGSQGLIFSITFLAKKDEGGPIELRDIKMLLNDGKGTPVDVKISNQIPISQILKPAIKDVEPPETFRPEVASDEFLFDGKYFLAFATQDKGSGIDYYEVKESRQIILSGLKKWVSAESPYLLKDQNLRSSVYIKAVDKAGNERIVIVEPRYPIKWYEVVWIWVIITISAAVIYFAWKKLWKK